jgi:pyruvate formate lyase activating enzyme
MARCRGCGRESPAVAQALGICAACLRVGVPSLFPEIEQAHAESRRRFGLPERPPQSEQGIACNLCVNECRLARGEAGYCGARQNVAGRLAGATADRANVSAYHDPLPTNCVASWVCPGETTAGYPQFTSTRGPEYGNTNLAVFYQACSFNCLFCQNWHFRHAFRHPNWMTAEELASRADAQTTCICHFGGDPGPQVLHPLKASRLARERRAGGILRICWETNGSVNPKLLDEMLDLSLESGGCLKFDLKAWNDDLHRALTGVSNARTRENFARAAARIPERPDPPPLIASTLLVPGYVDEEEVGAIARFLASLDPDLPYSLLAFHPQFCLTDLPTTSRAHAERCLRAALAAGLNRVKLGNVGLLGSDYEA